MNIEINLNKNLALKVKEASSQLNVGENDLIVKAIKRFLHTQEINLFRKDIKSYAKKSGFQSEQDIYNAIS